LIFIGGATWNWRENVKSIGGGVHVENEENMSKYFPPIDFSLQFNFFGNSPKNKNFIKFDVFQRVYC
jgi:hypothetical protein